MVIKHGLVETPHSWHALPLESPSSQRISQAAPWCSSTRKNAVSVHPWLKMMISSGSEKQNPTWFFVRETGLFTWKMTQTSSLLEKSYYGCQLRKLQSSSQNKHDFNRVGRTKKFDFNRVDTSGSPKSQKGFRGHHMYLHVGWNSPSISRKQLVWYGIIFQGYIITIRLAMGMT